MTQSQIRFKPSQIILGSAQLGMAYGIANTAGQPSETEAFAILDRAVELGINAIDTASDYGTAERLIGRWIAARKPSGVRVVTKVAKIPIGSSADRKHFVRSQIAASRTALGIEPLALVLAHEETDLLDPAVIEEFQSAVASGGIEAFGASVYQVEVAERLIATTPLAALQVPANIADCRFERAGLLRTARERNIAVFVRSIFLQGILLMTPERLPTHLKAFAPLLAALVDVARRVDCSVLEVLITAVRDVHGVTSLVLGADTASQLEPQIKALLAPPLPSAIRDELIQTASRLPRDVVMPINWKRLADAG